MLDKPEVADRDAEADALMTVARPSPANTLIGVDTDLPALCSVKELGLACEITEKNPMPARAPPWPC